MVRKTHKKVIVAIAHKMICLIFLLLTRKAAYQDRLGGFFYSPCCELGTYAPSTISFYGTEIKILIVVGTQNLSRPLGQMDGMTQQNTVLMGEASLLRKN